jgi:hypothetical protein
MEKLAWLLLVALGAGLLWFAVQIDPDGLGAEPGDLVATFQASGLESARSSMIVLGTLLTLGGIAGLVIGLRQQEGSGLEQPPELLGRLREGDSAVAMPERGTEALDPRSWQHEGALLYLFEGRSPLPLYDTLVAVQAGEPSVLVASLAEVVGTRRVLAVLGCDAALQRFDGLLKAHLGAAALPPEELARLRPDLQLQERSFDPSYRIEDPQPYRALRAQLSSGAFSVLAASPARS